MPTKIIFCKFWCDKSLLWWNKFAFYVQKTKILSVEKKLQLWSMCLCNIPTKIILCRQYLFKQIFLTFHTFKYFKQNKNPLHTERKILFTWTVWALSKFYRENMHISLFEQKMFQKITFRAPFHLFSPLWIVNLSIFHF